MRAKIINQYADRLTLSVEAEDDNDRTLLNLFLKTDSKDKVAIVSWTCHPPNIGIESIQFAQSATIERYLKYTSIFTIIFKKMKIFWSR
jgi:hypothetical protein